MDISFWAAVVCMALAFGLYGVIETLIKNWRKTRVAEQQAVLKKTMLDKGFSAEEIVRVIEAGGTADAKMAEA